MNKSRLAAAAVSLGCLLGSAAARAAPPVQCGALQIRGDVPGAISFDVYSQLHGRLQPLSAKRLRCFRTQAR